MPKRLRKAWAMHSARARRVDFVTTFDELAASRWRSMSSCAALCSESDVAWLMEGLE